MSRSSNADKLMKMWGTKNVNGKQQISAIALLTLSPNKKTRSLRKAAQSEDDVDELSINFIGPKSDNCLSLSLKNSAMLWRLEWCGSGWEWCQLLDHHYGGDYQHLHEATWHMWQVFLIAPFTQWSKSCVSDPKIWCKMPLASHQIRHIRPRNILKLCSVICVTIIIMCVICTLVPVHNIHILYRTLSVHKLCKCYIELCISSYYYHIL